MIWLGRDLGYWAGKGKVLELEQVWTHYNKPAEEGAIEVPRLFLVAGQLMLMARLRSCLP